MKISIEMIFSVTPFPTTHSKKYFFALPIPILSRLLAPPDQQLLQVSSRPLPLGFLGILTSAFQYHLQMTTMCASSNPILGASYSHSSNHFFVLEPRFCLFYCLLSSPLSSSFDVRLGVLHYWVFEVSECHEGSGFCYLELLHKRFHWRCHLCLAVVESNVGHAVRNSQLSLHVLIKLAFHGFFMGDCNIIHCKWPHDSIKALGHIVGTRVSDFLADHISRLILSLLSPV